MVMHIPRSPQFANNSERDVWERLNRQLGPRDVLIANQHLTADRRDHELDLVVAFDGLGIVVVEVKGGGWTFRDGTWRPPQGMPRKDPVEQAEKGKIALRDWVQKYTDFGHIACWLHAVVVPYTKINDADVPCNAQRWQIASIDEMPDLAGFLRAAITRRTDETGERLTRVALGELVKGLRRPPLPAPNRAEASAERAAEVERLTESQALILDAARALSRVHVRGGAGSGKTWLAMEQARRLTREGQRVALMCYSHGLASWMRRHTGTFDADERPEYVGTFLGLGARWGAAVRHDGDSDYWERELPEHMFDLAAGLEADNRFDAIVIDEGQDFAPSWWSVVHAALRDEISGGLYVFTDEGQQVFPRFEEIPSGLTPLVLERNLRNTRNIAAAFNSLAPIQMRLGDLEGPDVQLIDSGPESVLADADAAVLELLARGYNPADIALLTVGTRHPEQKRRQASGTEKYWDSFWDSDEVFYGHVLGFKGLERSAVVLAANFNPNDDRQKEKLYVGLSRARDELIVCGNRKQIRTIAGTAVLEKMRNLKLEAQPAQA
ncbi:nuclease [Epidermidibacterium keratini]|uniref:Nuclease n=1 Tax=Epidermidibacterium keratini TaxID=1891644 RepID=A0A7L4YRE4_9ACTN|nr:NERD domain-containing protein [Epidermidibacterium keratini]QHC01632.1 nuclease [Epidermidibacterium keratini]